MKCVFGIAFIIWGNLPGNALQLGVFMQQAINPTCHETDNCLNRGYVVAWGVGVLTLCALLNVASREYVIELNNVFAVLKLGFVAVITVVGIGYGAVNGDGCRRITWDPIDQRDTSNLGDIALALFFAMYPFTGYEQPFYVLSEVSDPQTKFAPATYSAMLVVLVLFPLANLSYLCMVPYTGNAGLPENMALAVIERLSGISPTTPSGERNPAAVRAVSALLAIFIFGNLMAQTYTASRVKAEIAKEGILPFSIQLSKRYETLFSRVGRYFTSSPRPALSDVEGSREHAPFPATVLHWTFEVILILAFGLTMEPSDAYGGLTYMYTYVIFGVFGFLTAAGLLYVKMKLEPNRDRRWSELSRGRPWLDPVPAVIATVCLGFLLLAAFAKPSPGKEAGWPWWVGPTVGLGSAFLGVLWWCGLRFIRWYGRWKLVIDRIPIVRVREGVAVQVGEVVKHTSVAVVRQ